MDCDQVFAVLTRGPFPSGAPEDVAVEVHLEQCLSCWRIADALRPAHNLCEETVPASEGHDLPGYWGDAMPTRAVYEEVRSTALRTAMQPQLRPPLSVMRLAPLANKGRLLWEQVVRWGVVVTVVTLFLGGICWLW